MKRLIIMMGIAGTVLVSACKKDDSTVTQPADPNTISNAQKNSVNTANVEIADPNVAQVSYDLTVAPPVTTQFLEWNSGYLVTGNIFFDGNVQLGNEMTKEHYTLATQKTITLLPAPSSGNANVLGSLSMLYGDYYAPEFGILLAGIYPPDANQNPTPALMLTGNYMKGSDNMAVQLIINAPVAVTAAGVNPTNIPGIASNYTASLAFDLRQLTAGLNANTLNNAVITNNTIIISVGSNQNLYQVVMNNLQSSLQVKLTPNVQNPTNQNPVPAQGAVR